MHPIFWDFSRATFSLASGAAVVQATKKEGIGEVTLGALSFAGIHC